MADATGAALEARIKGVAMPQIRETAEEAANRALIADSFEAWRNRTGSPFDLLAEHARWTFPGHSAVAGSYASKDPLIKKVIEPFNARMTTTLAPTKVRDIYTQGDAVIVFFDGAGMARDGEPYTNTYVWILRLEKRRIVDVNAFFDSVAFNALWSRVTPSA